MKKTFIEENNVKECCIYTLIGGGKNDRMVESVLSFESDSIKKKTSQSQKQKRKTRSQLTSYENFKYEIQNTKGEKLTLAFFPV